MSEDKQQYQVATQDQPHHAVAPVADSDNSVMAIISRSAADPKCDIEKLERLLTMHERLMDRDAKLAYAKAFAEMQPELPSVAERGTIKNKSGGVQSKYALWEDINDVLRPVLAQHGFSLSFRIKTQAGVVSVKGVLLHKGGYSEETTFDLPADTSGSKNSVQALASSVSYGKRYTAGALLNLTSHGDDDDGQAAGNNAPQQQPQQQAIQFITEHQVKHINQLLFNAPDGVDKHFRSKVPDIAQIPKEQFNRMTSYIGKLSQAAAKSQRQQGEPEPADDGFNDDGYAPPAEQYDDIPGLDD